jgi:hypothetical protein
VCFHVIVDNLKQFEPVQDAVSLNSFAVGNTLSTFTSCKYKKLWIWTYKSPNIEVKNFSPVGPIAGFHIKSLNVEHCIFTLKCLIKRLVIQCSELNQDEVCSLKTNENKDDSKHQNKHDLWFLFQTEKVVFIFAYIFNIFARKLNIRYQSPDDEKCMEPP